MLIASYFPSRSVAWVTLPVAVFHVSQRIRLDSPPDKVLMPFLAQLVRRSSGAQMLLMTVRTATRDQVEKIAQAEQDGSGDSKRSGFKTVPSDNFRFVHHSTSSQGAVNRSTEARTLAVVTKAIDVALESNGSSQSES